MMHLSEKEGGLCKTEIRKRIVKRIVEKYKWCLVHNMEVCRCKIGFGEHRYNLSMGTNDKGTIELLRGVFQTLFNKIQNNKTSFEWYLETRKWAKQKDNLWINQFESIFGYDNEVIRKAIIEKCEKVINYVES